MKIQILSDLHIEFGDFEVPRTDADIVVFAGDIGVGTEGLEWIIDQNIEKPVIYIPGNHEYYHHDLDLIVEIKALAPPNIHVLDTDSVILDKVRILGCTLWTDFLVFGEMDKWFSIQHAKKNMADFEVISLRDKRFTPGDSITIHEQHREWLKLMLSDSFTGKNIVVTHHFPSPKSIHPQFANDLLTPAFGSNLEEMMIGKNITLWIHGHTHDAFDYEIDNTRIVCNPRGYFGYESGEHFKADLVIEI